MKKNIFGLKMNQVCGLDNSKKTQENFIWIIFFQLLLLLWILGEGQGGICIKE
jgi:hypothetical protein